MLDTAISAPAVTGRLTRLAIPAAVATGVLNAALAAVQLLAPAQPTGGHHFVRTSDYIIEILFAASLLTAACAVLLLARYHRQLGRWGTFGTIAASAYALGTGLFGISSAATAARGVETLDLIQFPAIVLWLVAGLLMAIATARARVLPIVVGIGFAAGLPAVIALGHSGTLVLTVLWIAVAAALARKPASAGSPATPRH
jgi:phosphotransferase system  glucose/maltose/N-acetylglucosamine-specific IIC component